MANPAEGRPFPEGRHNRANASEAYHPPETHETHPDTSGEQAVVRARLNHVAGGGGGGHSGHDSAGGGGGAHADHGHHGGHGHGGGILGSIWGAISWTWHAGLKFISHIGKEMSKGGGGGGGGHTAPKADHGHGGGHGGGHH